MSRLTWGIDASWQQNHIQKNSSALGDWMIFWWCYTICPIPAPSWEYSRAQSKKQRMERQVAFARKCFLILLIRARTYSLFSGWNPCYIVASQPNRSKYCKGALIEDSTSLTRSRRVPGVSMQQCPGGKHWVTPANGSVDSWIAGIGSCNCTILQNGDVPMWHCFLAASSATSSSVIPICFQCCIVKSNISWKEGKPLQPWDKCLFLNMDIQSCFDPSGFKVI